MSVELICFLTISSITCFITWQTGCIFEYRPTCLKVRVLQLWQTQKLFILLWQKNNASLSRYFTSSWSNTFLKQQVNITWNSKKAAFCPRIANHIKKKSVKATCSDTQQGEIIVAQTAFVAKNYWNWYLSFANSNKSLWPLFYRNMQLRTIYFSYYKTNYKL